MDFRISLGSELVAKVTAMNVIFDQNKNPVKVKLRRYPAEQWLLLNQYGDSQMKVRFMALDATASWQAAIYLVPKFPPAKLRTNINLRSVNTSSLGEIWPVLRFQSERFDLHGSMNDDFSDVWATYCQSMFHSASYDACVIICLYGKFFSSTFSQGLRSAAPPFLIHHFSTFRCHEKFFQVLFTWFSIAFKTQKRSLIKPRKTLRKVRPT